MSFPSASGGIHIGDRVKVIDTKSGYYLSTGRVDQINGDSFLLALEEEARWFSRKQLIRLSYKPCSVVPTTPNMDGPQDEFEEKVYKLFEEARDLLLKKHHDYGPKNISNSPGGPINGLRVRLHDKFARIDNLLESGADPENESLRDSWLDSANYCIIAVLVDDGDWPEA